MSTVELLRPDADDVDGNWKDSAGGTTLYDKLDEVWSYSGAAIDMGFADSIYYDGSAYTDDPTSLLSCSRASVGYAKTRAGRLTAFSSNQLRITDLGLLVEDARTNECHYNHDMSNATHWTEAGTTAIARASGYSAPDGSTDAVYMTALTSASDYKGIISDASGSIASGALTLSCFFKSDGHYNYVVIKSYDGGNGPPIWRFNLATGVADQLSNPSKTWTNDSQGMEYYGDGWWRCWGTGTPPSFPATCDLRPMMLDNDGTTFQWTPTVTQGIYVWGAMIENGGFPSSYIPTTSAAATRAEDLISVSGALLTLVQQNTGSMVFHTGLIPTIDAGGNRHLLQFATPNHVYDIYGASSNLALHYNGTDLLATYGGGTNYLTSETKAGFAWNASGRSVVANNGTVASDANGNSLETTVAYLGRSLRTYMKRATFWSTKLADATLQALTDLSDTPYEADYDISSPITQGDSDTFRVRLSDPSGTPQAPGVVRFNCQKSGDDDMAMQVTLMQGSTDIAKWLEEDLTTAPQTFTETLTTDQFNAISNFNNLYLKFASQYQWWLDGATIDMDFANGRYFDRGLYEPVLLLHFAGADASTTFTDSTGRHPTVTAAGNVQIDTAQSVFGGSSALFDGTGDKLSIDDGTNDFDFGSGDFTIDFRFRLNALADNIGLWESYSGGSGRTMIGVYSGGVLTLYTNNDDRILTSSGAITTGVWYHVAVIRKDGVTKMYLDGTQVSGSWSGTFTGAPAMQLGYSFVMASFSGNSYLDGWIDEVRILKGRAAWSANFTLPTQAYSTSAPSLTPVTAGIGDPVVLLHMEGTDGSTTFTNSAKTGDPVVGGNAQIDTAQAKFGSSSALFSGSFGDAIRPINYGDISFGTGDYTIDFWFRANTVGGVGVERHLYFQNGSYAFVIFVLDSGSGAKLHFLSRGVDHIIGTTTITTGAWHHVALTRNRGITRLFLNGTQEGSDYLDDSFYDVSFTGANNGIGFATWDGWIDEFRICRSAAWTANFTPPTAPYDDPVTGPLSLLSCSRASTAYAKTSAGTLIQFRSDTLRLTDLGLLLENARTNTFLQSEDFSDASWTKSNTTVTANQSFGPDGGLGMDKIDDGSGTSVHNVNQAPSGLTANAVHTFSVFLKDVDRRYVQLMMQGRTTTGKLFAYFDLQTGTITDSGVIAGTGTDLGTCLIESFSSMGTNNGGPLLGGFYRCTISGIVNTTDTQFDCYISLSDRGTHGGSLSNDRPSYTGSTKSIYAWGAQLEYCGGNNAGILSSYIPTTTVAVTRASDNVTCIGSAAAAAAASAMSFVCENSMPWFDIDPSVESSRFCATLGGDATYNAVYYDGRSVLAANNNTTQLSQGVTSNSMTVRNKMGFSHSISSPQVRSIVANGGTVGTDGDPTTPMTFSTARLGYTPSTPQTANVLMTRFTFWNYRLDDTTLDGLTAL